MYNKRQESILVFIKESRKASRKEIEKFVSSIFSEKNSRITVLLSNHYS